MPDFTLGVYQLQTELDRKEIMPIQIIPEQQVAVIDEPGVIRVFDLMNKWTSGHEIELIIVICSDEDTRQSAYDLAVKIIAEPAIVHMARVAHGLENPRRLLPGGQLGEED